ncbi:hypothetical protein PR202_gb24281 [Eleusine coracana subsp. coracana]|uniref:F-box domain-containing protein n=1 Tax=Eleusine coracana subsp. coracana TaxID=191504 RepID=A0AAV5FL95_ELECO|nr:hypothetical protein PR202_gb24281 [Eleusine coracana subsp. coracana]
MERERRRRRKTKKAVAAAEVPPSTTSVHDIPDDLLRLILLCLASPLWLIRAAATCKRWRGVIAAADEGSAFLREARSLHPPTIIGHYHDQTFPYRTICFVRSSPPAPIDGSRFSLDFLPFPIAVDDGKTSGWEIVDCHGGLVLLRNDYAFRQSALIVCDPLTRRYQGIRGPPDYTEETGEFLCVYLLDGEDGTISISNFRLFGRFWDGARRGCMFSTRGLALIVGIRR